MPWSGFHSHSNGDTTHIRIAEDYFNSAYGAEEMFATGFHEIAHHLGWEEHTPRSGLNGAYGAEAVCIVDF